MVNAITARTYLLAAIAFSSLATVSTARTEITAKARVIILVTPRLLAVKRLSPASARNTADAVNVWVTVLRSVLGALKLVSARPSFLTLLDASLISARATSITLAKLARATIHATGALTEDCQSAPTLTTALA